MNPTLHVKIISPKETIFDGEALSVSSINSLGPFDVLAQHANFITIIEGVPIVIKTPDKNKEPLTFNFPIAIIYNINNKVGIYTDIQYNLF